MNAPQDTFQKRPPSHHHDTEELQEARTLSLGRRPHGEAAEKLVAEVADALRPLVARAGKPITTAPKRDRDKGQERRIQETGIILAGLMRSGFRGDWQAVHEGSARWFWGKDRNLPIGHNAFWKKACAMIELGFLDYVPGKGWKNDWGDWQGEEARIRPSAALLQLAESCGCTRTTAVADWPLRHPAPVLSDCQPVSIKPFPGAALPQDTVPQSLTDFMARLSSAMALHRITGCAAPVFQMSFTGSLDFGGRIYAKGADNYQNSLLKADRQFITIDDEPVAEVDISASFLSIALILSGGTMPPEGDLYDLPWVAPSHRAAVKQWFVGAFGIGKPCARWPKSTPVDIRDSIAASAICKAATRRYSFLSDLSRLVPAETMATVPVDYRSKAVGQFLTCVEAQIMRRAMDYIMAQGSVALPMHDALIVPRSWADKTREAIVRASKDRLGQPLRVTISDASGPNPPK
ncbi:hypothetical protein [Komagataeibacter xylinus]|uniref:hypothetical protein n=1 Tax=Komagataeibacter xylinus TaxID=28448 RepID=UPI00280C2FDE|nr:hypothetical protein [Komagataeibacter xylinus]